MSFDAASSFTAPHTDSIGHSDSDLQWLSFAAVSQLLTPRVGFIFSLFIILIAQYVTSPWRKVPSGPKGLPIIGNALQLKDKRWMLEKDCKRKFRTSNLFPLALVTRQVYQGNHRKSHVHECSGSTHGRH